MDLCFDRLQEFQIKRATTGDFISDSCNADKSQQITQIYQATVTGEDYFCLTCLHELL